jgi:hypothetical protein
MKITIEHLMQFLNSFGATLEDANPYIISKDDKYFEIKPEISQLVSLKSQKKPSQAKVVQQSSIAPVKKGCNCSRKNVNSRG